MVVNRYRVTKCHVHDRDRNVQNRDGCDDRESYDDHDDRMHRMVSWWTVSQNEHWNHDDMHCMDPCLDKRCDSQYHWQLDLNTM